MEEKLQKLMELKHKISLLKEEMNSLEEDVYSNVKNVLKEDKLTTTIRCNGGFKVTIKTNPKYKLIGEVPDGIDVYKKTVDETKLKKYANEDWVLSYENKPSITVVKEV